MQGVINAECHILFTIMLNIIMLGVVMLNGILLSVVAPYTSGCLGLIQFSDENALLSFNKVTFMAQDSQRI
jgi:hypothetical protein